METYIFSSTSTEILQRPSLENSDNLKKNMTRKNRKISLARYTLQSWIT